MKKLVEVVEVQGEGLVSLLGQQVMIFCVNYIYAGILNGVNDDFIQLKEPRIVYETGPFNMAGYKDSEALPGPLWNIQKSAMESWGLGK